MENQGYNGFNLHQLCWETKVIEPICKWENKVIEPWFESSIALLETKDIEPGSCKIKQSIYGK